MKIYLPKSNDIAKKLPVIIFSYGLGGSPEGYEFVVDYWATNGFVSMPIQHIGSDDFGWKGVPKVEIMRAMRKAASYKLHPFQSRLPPAVKLDFQESSFIRVKHFRPAFLRPFFLRGIPPCSSLRMKYYLRRLLARLRYLPATCFRRSFFGS